MRKLRPLSNRGSMVEYTTNRNIMPPGIQLNAGRPHDPHIPEFLTMHRPNFCSECGTKIIRLHWHPWTSRRFCDSCSRRLRKERLMLPLIIGSLLFSAGLVTGRALRPAPPPLIIQRSANSPLFDSDNAGGQGAQADVARPQPPAAEEVVYVCGARTKKGAPCSRRLHQPTRCWQHKGMPSIIPVVPIK